MQSFSSDHRHVSPGTVRGEGRVPRFGKCLAASVLAGFLLAPSAKAQVAAPTLSPSTGGSATKIPVVITCTTPGSTIYYTTNGQTPTQSDEQLVSSSTVYASGTLNVWRSMTLKAKAWVGSGTSTVTSGTYQVTGMVATGLGHSLALRFDGKVYAWGDQYLGGLGNNSTAAGVVTSPSVYMQYSSTGPEEFSGGVSIAAGSNHSLVLRDNGSVWATGANLNGQLGISSTTSKAVAEPVWSSSVPSTLSDVKQVAAGHGFSLALLNSGAVKSWGAGALGRLGNNNTSDQLTPVNVVKAAVGNPTLSNITQISAGKNFAGAVDDTGKLWTWGSNAAGQLGIGNTNDKDRADKVQERKSAINIVDMTNVSQVAAGEDHLLLVRSGSFNNMVWACGQGQYGTLGNGSMTVDSVLYPHEVQKAGGAGNLDNIIQIAAGGHVSLALDANGNVWSWGRNNTGALGDGTTTDRAYADKVKVSGTTPLANIVWVAAGGQGTGHCLAVDTNGKLYAWGNNATGMLANGGTSSLSYATWTGTTLSFTNNPPTGSLSVSGTLFNPPATVTLTATASDPEGAISRVRFYQGSTLIATDTTSPYSHQVNSLASGTYSYSAVIQDGAGATFTTGTSTVVVSGQPSLTVSAVPTTIAENSGTSAVFRIAATPTGTTALVVGFSLSGSAVNGTDYQTISNFTATLASGSSTVDVPITPLADAIYEGNESVVFTILSGTGYVVGSGSSATLTITQSQPGLISKNGGDGQVGAPGAYLAQPLSVLVLSGSGGTAQQNAPVLFTVTSGSGGLAAVSGDSSTSSSLTVYTGTNGIANAYYKQSLAGAATSTITAQSGTIASILTFTSTTTDPYGPIARWKFDEGTGTTAAEATGLGVSGTLTGGTTWTTGFDGDDAVAFSGTSQYVTMGAPAGEVLDFDTESFSIGFWIKYSSIAATARVLGKGYDNSGPGYGVWLTSDGKLKAAIGTTNSGTAASATLAFGTQSAFNDNQWHQVTVSFDRTAATARIYVDGIVQKLEIVAGTGGSVGPSDATVVAYPTLTELNAAKTDKAFTVGSKDGTADFLPGAVDDIRFYSRALNLTEATGLFNADSDGDGMPDAWEQRYLGGIGASPTGNADGDGALNNVDARPNDNSIGQMGINITTPANGSTN